MPQKPVWQSLTLWFNVAAAVYEVLAAQGAFSAFPPEVRASILILGNVLLRFKTTQGVTLR